MAERTVKEGDVVRVGGVDYVFGETSTEAFNSFRNLPTNKLSTDGPPNIHQNQKDGAGSDLISLRKLREILGIS